MRDFLISFLQVFVINVAIVSLLRFFSLSRERLIFAVLVCVLLASQKAKTAASACESSFSDAWKLYRL